MPNPKAGLVAGIVHLFDAQHAPHAATKLHAALPTILEHFFPWARWDDPEARGMPLYLADCVLLYALQSAKAELPQPHLHAFIDDFCAALSVARKITRVLELGEDIDVVIAQGLRRFLQDGRAVLCPGGMHQGTDGHAVMALLLPQPGGSTVCAVFNRGEGLSPWHRRDLAGKPQPWVACVPTEALCGEAGAGPLRALLALQVPDAANSMDAFYAALNDLVQGCDGDYLLAGSPNAQALCVPGQSLSKANECTISNTFAAMNFLMHVQLRCWQSPPSCTPAEAHAVYREIKFACRKVILREVVAERADAMVRGDTPQVIALTHALCRAATFMQERRSRHPALHELYRALPSDVRLCADATKPSSV